MNWGASPSRLSISLFNNGPIVVALVTCLIEQPDPALRIIVPLGRQHPVLEDRLLLGCAIGIELNESPAARDALQFGKRPDATAAIQIVDGIERYRRLEAVVGK